MILRRPVRRVLAALAIVALLVAGCAGTARRPTLAPLLDGPRPRLALLPLENLSGKAEAGDQLTRMLFVELVRRGDFEVVESGVVEAAMESLRVRSTSSLTRAQMRDFGDRLTVEFIMAGTVLESGMTRTPEGDVPSTGMALKLLEVASGRVVWAQMKVRTGDDRETLFGWGREQSAEKLAASLAREILVDLRVPAAAPPADSAKGVGK